MGQDRHADQQTDLSTRAKRETDGQAIDGAVGDQTDRAEHRQRRIGPRNCRGVFVRGGGLGVRRQALVLVLPGLAMHERLEGREDEKSKHGGRAGQHRVGARADQGGALGQEIGHGGRDEHAGREGHEGVQAMPEPNRGRAPEQGREEGQDGESNQHGGQGPGRIR